MHNEQIALLVPVHSFNKHEVVTFLNEFLIAYTGFEKLIFACEVTDNFPELEHTICERLNKESVKYEILKFHGNRGLGYALNNSVKLINEEYICRHDIGDSVYKNKFQVIHNTIKKKSFDLLYTNAIISKNGKEVLRRCPSSIGKIKKSAIFSSPFIHPTVTFKREAVLSVGNYDADLRHCEDLDLWLRMIKFRKVFFHVPEATIMYNAPSTIRPTLHWISNLRVRMKNISALPILYSITGILIVAIFLCLPTKLKKYIYKKRL